MLTASVGGVLLEVPPHWRPAPATQQIPGLAIRHAILLAPGGDPSQAGLIAGALPGRQASPLPASLLALLHQRPTAAVVSLQETQAYRYTGLSIAGFDRSLTAYVVPKAVGGSIALVCYAAPSLSAQVQACQRSVATLTVAGQSQTYDLTPQPEYAQRLSAAISALDAQRVALRAQMGSGVTPHALQRLAARLAHAFAQAAASLSALEPTLATGRAQAGLSGAILGARAAYSALASAAGAGDEARFGAARAQVAAAELGVDSALEAFALLGYQSA
jgi:hypothetical protein